MWNCEMSQGVGSSAGGSGGGGGFQLPEVHQVQIIQQQQLQQQHLNRWGGDLELATSPYFFVDPAVWGSDLELASPGGFDSCIMDSSWTSSNKEQHCCAPAPAQGLETIPSPTSSEVSIRNLSHHNSQQQNIAPRQIQQHQQQQQHQLQQQQSQQFYHHQEQYHHHQHHEQYHHHQDEQHQHHQDQHHQLIQATNAPDLHVDVSSSSSVNSLLNRTNISGNSSKTSNDGQSHLQHQNHRHGHHHHHLQEQQQQQQRSNCGAESVGSPSGGSIGFNRENGGNAVAGGNLVDGANDLGNDLVDVSNKVASATTSSSAALRGPSERMMDISLEDLSRYFTMPITQASKELKVGLTVLKKRCREFGIPRWPHRKLKSLESLIHKSQELAKDSDGNAPNPVIHAVHELEKQKKKMEQSPGIELDDRTKRFRQAIFKASYKQRRRAVAPSNGSSGGGNSDSSQASHNNGSTGAPRQEQELQQQ